MSSREERVIISMIRAKFRDAVRSRTDVAMKNEVLCNMLAHNLCCLVMSRCGVGIEPIFWPEANGIGTQLPPASREPEPDISQLSSQEIAFGW